jgi:hypothetical protein
VPATHGTKHQQYLSSLQAKTESRLRILTILSSIRMPLTLIACIYGMNFARMPETQLARAGRADHDVGDYRWSVVVLYKRGWFG